MELIDIREFVGQVANLPFARQVGNLPHEFASEVPMQGHALGLATFLLVGGNAIAEDAPPRPYFTYAVASKDNGQVWIRITTMTKHTKNCAVEVVKDGVKTVESRAIEYTVTRTDNLLADGKTTRVFFKEGILIDAKQLPKLLKQETRVFVFPGKVQLRYLHDLPKGTLVIASDGASASESIPNRQRGPWLSRTLSKDNLEKVAGLAGLAMGVPLVQTWVPEPGVTLPSAYYLEHPPQYIPPSKDVPFPR